MSESYSYSKKQKLATSISKLKKKEDMINIMNIISKDDVNITENQNGLFLIFNDLSDNTYYKIENYLTSLKKTSITNSDTSSDKKKYASYCIDDLNPQDIRYTSKERNIIKKQRYENIINEINN
jgi:hypothetical protein